MSQDTPQSPESMPEHLREYSREMQNQIDVRLREMESRNSAEQLLNSPAMPQVLPNGTVSIRAIEDDTHLTPDQREHIQSNIPARYVKNNLAERSASIGRRTSRRYGYESRTNGLRPGVSKQNRMTREGMRQFLWDGSSWQDQGIIRSIEDIHAAADRDEAVREERRIAREARFSNATRVLTERRENRGYAHLNANLSYTRGRINRVLETSGVSIPSDSLIRDWNNHRADAGWAYERRMRRGGEARPSRSQATDSELADASRPRYRFGAPPPSRLQASEEELTNARRPRYTYGSAPRIRGISEELPAPQAPRNEQVSRIPQQAPSDTRPSAEVIAQLDVSPNAKTFVKNFVAGFPVLRGREGEVANSLKNVPGFDFSQQGHETQGPRSLNFQIKRHNKDLPQANRLRETLQLSWKPFTPSSLDEAFSLMTLATEPHIEEVVGALRGTSLNFSGFENQRTQIDLEQDRSSIAYLCRSLPAALPDDAIARKNLILEKWKELRLEQQKSFREGPDVVGIDANNVPVMKPIDVLVLDCGASDPREVKSAQSIMPLLNIRPEQTLASKFMLKPVSAVDYPHPQALAAKLREQQKISEGAGRHLMLFVIGHSHRTHNSGRITMVFSGGQKDMRLDQLLAPPLRPPYTADQIHLVPEKRSVFFSSCFSGDQAQEMMQSAEGRKQLQNVHFSVLDTTDSINPYDVESHLIPRGLTPDSNGLRPADINRDGAVTMNELQYWLNTQGFWKNSTTFDRRGVQIAQKEQSEEHRA